MTSSTVTFAGDGSPLLHVSLDSLTVSHSPGSPGHHALIRASHSLSPHSPHPFLHFEAFLNPPTPHSPHLRSSPLFAPHVRVGVATAAVDTDVPVGWGDSYGYIGRTGETVHGREVKGYGRAYGVGDVVGVTVERGRGKGLQVRFAVNGVCQGVAFEGVEEAEWFPAVSLYSAASVTCAFEPPFAYWPPTVSARMRTLSPLNALSAAVRAVHATSPASPWLAEYVCEPSLISHGAERSFSIMSRQPSISADLGRNSSSSSSSQ